MGLKSRFNSLSKRRKVLSITGCLLLVLLVLCGCLGTTYAIVASSNLGKRNALSTLSQTLPTENLPLIKQFGKSHEQIVQDAFVLRSDEDYAKNFSDNANFQGTFLANGKMETSLLLKTPQGDVTADVDFISKTNYNFKDKVIKQNATISGNINSGVVSIDLKTNPIDFESISQENNKDIYFKLSITDKLLNSLYGQSGVDNDVIKQQTGINFKDYINSYVKVNTDELQKELEKIGGTTSSSRVYTKEELAKFSNELIENYNNTISSKFSTFAKVEYIGREDVNGIASIRYKLTIDKVKFQEVFVNFLDTLPQALVNNKNLFIDANSCESKLKTKTANPGFCNDAEIAALKKSYTDTKPELVKSLTNFFASIDIDDFYVNIIPATNSIIKFEFKISVNNFGRSEINKTSTGSNKTTLEKLTFKVSGDYQIKFDAEKIEIPQNAKNLLDLYKDIDAYQKKLLVPTRNPGVNDGLDYYNL